MRLHPKPASLEGLFHIFRRVVLRRSWNVTLTDESLVAPGPYDFVSDSAEAFEDDLVFSTLKLIISFLHTLDRRRL